MWFDSYDTDAILSTTIEDGSHGIMVSVCTGLLGEEGRVSTSVDTRL